jgi:4-hydroxybenzoate polyprenyltransferase
MTQRAEASSGEEPVALPPAEPPLFVDLDGTLVKTDLLLESLLVMLKAQPWTLLLLPFWLLGGRARLKSQIARRAHVAADTLIYDAQLVARLEAERRSGRTLVLATASNRKYADAVATHLGFFGGVIASNDQANLKGRQKVVAILEHTGGGPFDYAGNSSADLPIWRKARKVICVDTPGSVVRTVRTFAEPETMVTPRRAYLKLLIKAIRVHQWLKNALIFVPIAAAHHLGDVKGDLRVVAAFFAFSFLASSVYLMNDLTDLRSDRLHPRKRTRPFASGELPLHHGLALIPVLLGSSITIAVLCLPLPFLGVLGIYYMCSLAYNFWAKERVVWDVVLLAGLYVLRVIAGAAAVPVPASFWLLAFSMFIFSSLALAKRYSEMASMSKLGRTNAHGRGYLTDDMPILQSMGVAAGYMAVLVMALYINSPEIHALYMRPQTLWGICPLLLFWMSRIWVKTHRGEMHDDPVVFAVKDRVSVLVGALCAVCVAAGNW